MLFASLPFLGVLVGMCVTAAINIAYSKYRFAPLVERHGIVAPEHRLVPMMIGAHPRITSASGGSHMRVRAGSVTFPIGFFLLAWTSAPAIHWFPSVLGLTFIGMSFLLIFQGGINYLIDAYTTYKCAAAGAGCA
jgi:DHA1 family multidrug resistance protein-like MFS transporter